MTEPAHPGDPSAPTFPAAGLDRRFYAFAVDRLVAWTAYAVVAWVAWVLFLDRGKTWTGIGVMAGFVVVVSLGFAVLLGTTGLSPGKALLGLRAVHHGTGTRVGVARAAVRGLVLGVAALPTFGLGLATLAWTAVMDPGRQRRGWHDQVARSIVVDVRPPPEDDADVRSAPRHVVNLTAMRLVPSPPSAPEPPPAPAPRVSPAPSRSLPPTGQPQPTQPQPAQPQPAQPGPTSVPPPADSGRTVVRGSPTTRALRWRVVFDTGDSLVVEGLGIVGRKPEARAGEPVRHVVPLPSADMSLSKTHAQFHLDPDGVLVVMDRGSTNGSVLLRQGVRRDLAAGRPATLVDGDRVRFGDREMTVSREA
ncbi:MAG: RDD family protein [Nocardioides sp.]